MVCDPRRVEMAAQLYIMRDKAKRLLGDRYQPYMADLGLTLTAIAQRDGKDVLAAAAEFCEKRDIVGMQLLLVWAAAVELIEPSAEPRHASGAIQ